MNNKFALGPPCLADEAWAQYNRKSCTTLSAALPVYGIYQGWCKSQAWLIIFGRQNSFHIFISAV